MEDLQEIAAAHYQAGSQRVRALAHEFFDSLDVDGDGEVDYNEFLAFMRQEGCPTLTSRYMFSELDTDGSGTLDFWEVMTLYYIIKSGRPFCDVCGELIAEVFFTCVACYQSPRGTFDLCLDCYRSGTCDHNHNGRSQFLDSFTMLYNMRNLAIAARLANQNQPRPQTSNEIVAAQRAQSFNAQSRGTYYPPQAPAQRSSSSNAIVPAARRVSSKIRTPY